MNWSLSTSHPQSWLASILVLAIWLVGAIVTASVLYCFALLVSAWSESRTRKRRAKISRSAATHFCILIPAHDESLVIESTLLAVSALDYPQDLFECVVIADNCTDQTASLASATIPTARVLQRINLDERGKGFALNWAIAQLIDETRWDAIVIVDADTHMDRGFLTAMDAEFQKQGPDKDKFVAQGLYEVLNSGDNWRTALMAGALSLVHFVRPMARERWGTSVGLKGNGMCFAIDVLRNTKWRGRSLIEDIEFGLDLIETRGIRIRFVPEAIVAAQMPTGEGASRGQRRRWEHGRSNLIRARVLPMLFAGLMSRDKLKLDASLDLLCPPTVQICMLLFLWAALIILAVCLHASVALAIGCWLGAALLFSLYIVLGFKIGNAPDIAFSALGMAIPYGFWKIYTLMTSKAKNSKHAEWVRTERTAIEPTTTDTDSIDIDSLQTTNK